jgi:hypothetical protein
MSGAMSQRGSFGPYPRHLQIGGEDRQPGGDGKLQEDSFLVDAGLI